MQFIPTMIVYFSNYRILDIKTLYKIIQWNYYIKNNAIIFISSLNISHSFRILHRKSM